MILGPFELKIGPSESFFHGGSDSDVRLVPNLHKFMFLAGKRFLLFFFPMFCGFSDSLIIINHHHSLSIIINHNDPSSCIRIHRHSQSTIISHHHPSSKKLQHFVPALMLLVLSRKLTCALEKFVAAGSLESPRVALSRLE